jgi:hypothetical protein
MLDDVGDQVGLLHQVAGREEPADEFVAGRVGGIEDQVEDGRSGILVDDPKDLATFGSAVHSPAGGQADRLRARTRGAPAARGRARDYL